MDPTETSKEHPLTITEYLSLIEGRKQPTIKLHHIEWPIAIGLYQRVFNTKFQDTIDNILYPELERNFLGMVAEYELTYYDDTAGDISTHVYARQLADTIERYTQPPALIDPDQEENTVILSNFMDDWCLSCTVGNHCLEEPENLGLIKYFFDAAKEKYGDNVGTHLKFNTNTLPEHSDITIYELSVPRTFYLDVLRRLSEELFNFIDAERQIGAETSNSPLGEALFERGIMQRGDFLSTDAYIKKFHSTVSKLREKAAYLIVGMALDAESQVSLIREIKQQLE